MAVGWSITTVMTITYTNGGAGTDTIEYEGITFDVGCTIVDIPNPTNPSEDDGYVLTYTLYDAALQIDLSAVAWTQSPPCDYPATSTVVWTNPEPAVVFVISDFLLSIFTVDKTKLGSHTLTAVNTLDYDGGSWSPEITFDITILDPCESTVLQAQSITAMTTQNGVPLT